MNPPGWYPSPERPDHMQYWDGMQWTSQLKALNELPASHLPPPAMDAHFPGEHSGTGTKPDRIAVKGAPSMRQAVSLVLFGLLWLAISALPVSMTLSGAFSTGPTAEGTVVDVTISESYSRDSRTVRRTCSPVAEFTVDGKTYTASSNVFTYPCRWNTGQAVEVAYKAGNPADARVKSDGFNPLILVFPLVGFAVIGSGVWTAIRVRREKANDGFVPVGHHNNDW